MTPPFSPETNTNNNLTISSSCNNNIDSNSNSKSCPVIKCTTTIAATAAPPEVAKTDSDSTVSVLTDEKSIKTGPKMGLVTQNSVATMTSPAESSKVVVTVTTTAKMQQQPKHQPLAKTNSNAKTVVPPVVVVNKENAVLLPALSPSMPTPTSPTVHEPTTPVVGVGQPFKLSYAQVAHSLKEQQPPSAKEENNNNISIVDKEKSTDKENKERKKDASPNSRVNSLPRGGKTY